MKKEVNFLQNLQHFMKNRDFRAVCYSHIGKRQNQEDNFLFDGISLTLDNQKQRSEQPIVFSSKNTMERVKLFAISDGMGGHNAGEVASRICVEKLAEIEPLLQNYHSMKDIVAFLQFKIAEINRTVYEMSCRYEAYKGMGATLVLCVLYGMECVVLNVGDSRAYYFDGSTLMQITKDNTEGQRMLDLGLLTRKELLHFPARKHLNRYIGYAPTGFILQADEYYPQIKDGTILLCSDGISDFLSDKQIVQILQSELDLEKVGMLLIKEAILSTSADNATMILLSMGEVF